MLLFLDESFQFRQRHQLVVRLEDVVGNAGRTVRGVDAAGDRQRAVTLENELVVGVVGVADAQVGATAGVCCTP